MRIVVLIALLMSFTAGSYDASAKAAMGNHNCVEELILDNGDSQADPCHSEQEKNHEHEQCDDCRTCCSHSQSMTSIGFTSYDLPLRGNDRFIIQAEHSPSFNPQGLKRPPRL